jgi:hypothetical protein
MIFFSQVPTHMKTPTAKEKNFLEFMDDDGVPY